jgi:hypothetical protein
LSYKLVLGGTDAPGGKDFGENVFFDRLPKDYQVYLFYYPGIVPNPELEDYLRKLGDGTGKNLFVNLGKLNDTRYGEIVKRFGIRSRPVIIMTAQESLASWESNGGPLTAFVRLDRKELFLDVLRTMDCVNRLYDLFVSQRIPLAIKEAKSSQLGSILDKFRKNVVSILIEIGRTIDQIDFTVSILEGVSFKIKTR